MEKRLFEDLIDSDRVKHRTQRSKTVPVSLVLHLVAAGLIIIVPLFAGSQLPEPQAGVKAFFAEPLSAPAPPPPPPPPAARPAVVSRVPPKPVPQDNRFVAPVDIPQEIKPEEGLDLGAQGTGGGVEGGVPGGVVGGVVGGLPTDAPPPPAKVVRIGGQIAQPKLIRQVKPVYPDLAVQSRVSALVILEAEVDTRGHVKTVKVLRGHPLFDDAAMEAVKQWRYQPLLLNGEPTGFILTVTVNFNLQQK
jgi:protein TonB